MLAGHSVLLVADGGLVSLASCKLLHDCTDEERDEENVTAVLICLSCGSGETTVVPASSLRKQMIDIRRYLHPIAGSTAMKV